MHTAPEVDLRITSSNLTSDLVEPAGTDAGVAVVLSLSTLISGVAIAASTPLSGGEAFVDSFLDDAAFVFLALRVFLTGAFFLAGIGSFFGFLLSSGSYKKYRQ